jgi:hypothetical protein
MLWENSYRMTGWKTAISLLIVSLLKAEQGFKVVTFDLQDQLVKEENKPVSVNNHKFCLVRVILVYFCMNCAYISRLY